MRRLLSRVVGDSRLTDSGFAGTHPRGPLPPPLRRAAREAGHRFPRLWKVPERRAVVERHLVPCFVEEVLGMSELDMCAQKVKQEL